MITVCQTQWTPLSKIIFKISKNKNRIAKNVFKEFYI